MNTVGESALKVDCAELGIVSPRPTIWDLGPRKYLSGNKKCDERILCAV